MSLVCLRNDCYPLFLSNVLGQIVRKPINADPGLNVNQSIYFSCIKLFFTAYVLCSLGLVKFKTEEGTE